MKIIKLTWVNCLDGNHNVGACSAGGGRHPLEHGAPLAAAVPRHLLTLLAALKQLRHHGVSLLLAGGQPEINPSYIYSPLHFIANLLPPEEGMSGEMLDLPLEQILHVSDGVQAPALPQHVGVLGQQGLVDDPPLVL